VNTYWNDERPMPDEEMWECCDCRNVIKIRFIEVYPHNPRYICYCPICGAKSFDKDSSFRKL